MFPHRAGLLLLPRWPSALLPVDAPLAARPSAVCLSGSSAVCLSGCARFCAGLDVHTRTPVSILVGHLSPLLGNSRPPHFRRRRPSRHGAHTSLTLVTPRPSVCHPPKSLPTQHTLNTLSIIRPLPRLLFVTPLLSASGSIDRPAQLATARGGSAPVSSIPSRVAVPGHPKRVLLCLHSTTGGRQSSRSEQQQQSAKTWKPAAALCRPAAAPSSLPRSACIVSSSSETPSSRPASKLGPHQHKMAAKPKPEQRVVIGKGATLTGA